MHSLLFIVTNTLVILLRLVGLLLHKLLLGVFPGERMSRARRVNMVHWSLLLVQRFPDGDFNIL